MATRSSLGIALEQARQLVLSGTWLRNRSSTSPDCWRVDTRMIGSAWLAPWSSQRVGSWVARVMPTLIPDELARYTTWSVMQNCSPHDGSRQVPAS
jgi:hypothetical protein